MKDPDGEIYIIYLHVKHTEKHFALKMNTNIEYSEYHLSSEKIFKIKGECKKRFRQSPVSR